MCGVGRKEEAEGEEVLESWKDVWTRGRLSRISGLCEEKEEKKPKSDRDISVQTGRILPTSWVSGTAAGTRQEEAGTGRGLRKAMSLKWSFMESMGGCGVAWHFLVSPPLWRSPEARPSHSWPGRGAGSSVGPWPGENPVSHVHGRGWR